MSLAVSMIVALLSGALGAQNVMPDFAALSGRWEGQQVLLQINECTINNSGVMGARIRLDLNVSSDGTLTARAYFDGRKEPVPDTWTGIINPDHTVTLDVPTVATCSGVERRYTKRLTGQLTEQKGKPQLKVEGDDTPCPDQRCAFKSTITVRRR
jgi:hypothetical protein